MSSGWLLGEDQPVSPELRPGPRAGRKQVLNHWTTVSTVLETGKWEPTVSAMPVRELLFIVGHGILNVVTMK